MDNHVEKDTKKTIDRLSTVSSSASSNTFDLIDKGAKKLSDIKENREIKKAEQQEENTSTSRLKTSENNQNDSLDSQNSDASKETISRLKTNVNESNKSDINNDSENLDSSFSEAKVTNKNSRLKTVVSKVSQKTFKFNDNQGKISKATTIVSKSGKGVSKFGKTITRTSRELNKAISNDGTGLEYIDDKIKRKLKTKGNKIVKKGTNKIKKKFNQTIGKKLVQIGKRIIVKLVKMLISLFLSLAEIIIPAALVILIIVALGSIFGSSSSEKDIENYSNYMASIQEEYNRQVDDWVKDNPDGIVVGVKGNYGQIDWRIPLGIIQSTGAELKFDQDEKNLLESFKNADLFEKHEVYNQTIEETKDGVISEKEIPVLVITNAVYEDYIDWCKNNYSIISEFNKNKKVSDGSDTWFTNDQLELLEMLYQSDDYAEILGSDFKTHTPSYGSNDKDADLKSDFYNSKNTLANAGYKGQCTWFSFGRALELSNKKMPVGNAQTWLSSAVNMGLQTGSQPSFNSVVVLIGGKYGHVAFVEAYDSKSITISEGNVGNPCSNDDSCSAVEYANNHAEEMVRKRTYSSFDEYRQKCKSNGQTIVGFIYLD